MRERLLRLLMVLAVGSGGAFVVVGAQAGPSAAAAPTSDGGATVAQSFDGCGTSPGADRPWLAAYDPPPGIPHQSAYTGPAPLIYQEYNNLAGPGPNSGGQWNKSTDGLNYTNATNGVTTATEATYSPFGADGYPAVDQQTGKVFEAAGFPNGD